MAIAAVVNILKLPKWINNKIVGGNNPLSDIEFHTKFPIYTKSDNDNPITNYEFSIIFNNRCLIRVYCQTTRAHCFLLGGYGTLLISHAQRHLITKAMTYIHGLMHENSSALAMKLCLFALTLVPLQRFVAVLENEQHIADYILLPLL